MTISDNDLAAVRDVFLADVPARLERIEAELADATPPGDRDALTLEAHTLKGAAATVGLSAVAELAARLETAVAEGDEREARINIDLIRAAVDPEGTPRTVVCIEDDPTNLLLIRRIAASCAGVAFLTAGQGAQGLDLVRKHLPDLVLLDLRLADIPGEEVLRRVRSDTATHDVPVVVLSAEAMPERIEELRAAGATDYVTKPYDVDRLSGLLLGHNAHRT